MKLNISFQVALLALELSSTCIAHGAPNNLLPNGGFESVTTSGLPVNWRTYTPRTGPSIGTTETQPYEGTRCAEIETTSDLIGLLVSDPAIEVAPGEKLAMGVRCRTENVQSDTGGGLTYTAAFLGPNDRIVSWDRGNPPADNSGKWTELSRTVTVPEGNTTMMFQVGLRRAHGRSWWDAASLVSESQVALRLDVPLSPSFGDTTIPALLLNRLRPAAQRSVDVLTNPGNHITRVALDDATTQAVELPFTFRDRGKFQLSAEVRDAASGNELFITSQTATISAPIVVEPLIPTHWVVEDAGPAGFETQLRINVERHIFEGSTLACTITDAAGHVIAHPGPMDVTRNPMDVKVDLAINEVPKLGNYQVRFVLQHSGKTVATATEDWHVIHRAQALTTISPDGYPVVDGKKFFPLAMYMGERDHFNELKKAGFNVTQSYPAFAGPGSSNRTVKEFLDKANDAGLKTLTFISHGPERLSDADALTRIRTFKNHPATLVWYQEEVLARGYKPISYVANLVETLRRIAPEHPILQGDQRDESSRMVGKTRWFPDEYMDFGTWWWYPTPLRESASMENYEGDPSGPEKEYKPPKFLTDNGTSKPIWMAIQCYAKPGQSDARFPTPEEYRCHAYLSICHGAKGLLYYTGLGENGTGVLSRKKEGHWDYLKKLAGELREMSPVFMSPDAAAQAEVVTSGALISTRLKNLNDGRYLLIAVNRGIRPVTAQIRVAGYKSAVPVRYEHRSLKLKQEILDDKFSGYAVHLYELRSQ